METNEQINGENLREGIFALRTRRFGSVAEYMVKRLNNLGASKSLFHDLYCTTHNRRIEVKFSTVMKKAEVKITEDTVLRCIDEARAEKRSVKFSEITTTDFDCNIQQVKRAEFDVLYYGLFFYDCIKIFKVESKDIKTKLENGDMGYSNKQHKGNEGEGQFHVNKQTIAGHLERYLHATLTYAELYTLLKGNCP